MAPVPARHVSLSGCWRRLKAALAGTPPDLPESDWDELRRAVPWIAGLDAERLQRLRRHTARFLTEKAIVGAGGLEPTPVQRRIVAALCCLPVLEYGYQGLRGWCEVILYPDTFRAHRSHYDEYTGVVTEGEEDLAGEVWERGPVILSWGDIEADLAEPDAGFLVAVHEIAHKLDLLDGVFDGTPPLPAAWHRAWVRDFQAAYDALGAEVEAGRETAIDPYAASAPEEFFAVCSEYHFTAPEVLAAALPAVASHLERFYGPSPMCRLESGTEAEVSPHLSLKNPHVGRN